MGWGEGDWSCKILIPKSIKNDTDILYFDVLNSYTVIPTQYRLETINVWPTETLHKISTIFEMNFITERLNLILENNIFHSDVNIYKQISGNILMRTKVSPTYANNIMAYKKAKIHDKSKSMAYTSAHICYKSRDVI